MRFYTKIHKHYCGIDLHAKKMYLCILDASGNVLLHRNIASSPESFLKAVAPFKDDLIVGVECMFAWYWLAYLCRKEGIEFILGHALFMKGYPRWESEERQDRFAENSRAFAWRHISGSLRVSSRDAGGPRSAKAQMSSGA